MKSSKSIRKILAVTLSTLLLLSASFTLLSQDISVDADAAKVVKSKDGQKYDENHNIVIFVGEQGIVLGGYTYDYIVTGDWQIKSGDSIKMVKATPLGERLTA